MLVGCCRGLLARTAPRCSRMLRCDSPVLRLCAGLVRVLRQLAVYNLVSRVTFSMARDRNRDRRRRRCRCDLLMRISVLTVVGMVMKAVLVIDPFGSLGIFNNAVRTCLVRVPEVLGCLCLAMVVQVWASVATCVTGPSNLYLLSWLVNGGIIVMVAITLPA